MSDPASIINGEKIRRDAVLDDRVRRFSQSPFAIKISSPYVRAMLAAAEAKRKYEPLPSLSVADWNAAGVVVSVSPKGTLTDLRAIENVIIQRDGATIRPRKSDVNLITLQNAMGAQATTTEGLFFFDFSVFEPTSLITVVLIGASTNFEFSLTSDELKRMR
jgi:hypothetical protein